MDIFKNGHFQIFNNIQYIHTSLVTYDNLVNYIVIINVVDNKYVQKLPKSTKISKIFLSIFRNVPKFLNGKKSCCRQNGKKLKKSCDWPVTTILSRKSTSISEMDIFFLRKMSIFKKVLPSSTKKK